MSPDILSVPAELQSCRELHDNSSKEHHDGVFSLHFLKQKEHAQRKLEGRNMQSQKTTNEKQVKSAGMMDTKNRVERIHA